MTLPVPDLSTTMLSIFLNARIVAKGGSRRSATAQVGRVIRRDARITHRQFMAAVDGMPLDDETRMRIWRALGVEAP